jgi:hypothetical protein
VVPVIRRARGVSNDCIEEGRAASKSPHEKFGYFLSLSQQGVSANLIQKVCLLVVSLVTIIPHPPLTHRVYSPQSTYIYRAPQCMSPRWNWDSPTPLAASECALPPGPKGGGAHSPAAKGVGSPNSDAWRNA